MTFNFAPNNLFTIEHLRFKRLWLFIGFLLIVGVVVASVVKMPNLLPAFSWSDKVLHCVVYAGLMGWFAQIYRHDLTRVIFAILLFSLGVAIEFLQAATPTRQFEVSDMIANTCGVLLAWALAYTWVGTILPRFESLFIHYTESQT